MTQPAARPPGGTKHPFVIVTGLSGSGKSLVHRCFEDMGYFCVDNLPIELIPKFAEMRERGGAALGHVALTVDVREREYLGQFPAVYQDLKERHPQLELIFLEADDEALVKRFSETRRPHPLAGGQTTLPEALALERQLLAELRARADLILDTSDFTVHELRRHLFDRYARGEDTRLQVAVQSFAYRHGLPKQADLVLDVRFLPNPHFDEKLRPFSGRDEPVRRFLAEREEYTTFMRKLADLVDFLMPGYQREGKSYLTIAVGCTGGRHRSVAVAEELGEMLRQRGMDPVLSHRDIDRQG